MIATTFASIAVAAGLANLASAAPGFGKVNWETVTPTPYDKNATYNFDFAGQPEKQGTLTFGPNNELIACQDTSYYFNPVGDHLVGSLQGAFVGNVDLYIYDVAGSDQNKTFYLRNGDWNTEDHSLDYSIKDFSMGVELRYMDFANNNTPMKLVWPVLPCATETTGAETAS